MNKRAAGPIESWIDYILIFVIGFFGFVFLFTFLSLSLFFRTDLSVKAAESTQIAENLILVQRGAYAEGLTVDITNLRNQVNYVNTYKLPPPQPVQPRSGRFN